MTNNNCVNNYIFNCSNNYNFNIYQILDDSKSAKDLSEDTDLSLTTFSENELDIEPKPSTFSPLSATAQEVIRNLEKLNLEKSKNVEQKAATKIHSKRGFNLICMGESRKIKLNDKTGIAENFINTNLGNPAIAQRHMWKRINFFLVISRYIQEKTPFLANMNFPTYQKGQFTAQACVVPESYRARKKGYERAHISILNKIVIQQDDKLCIMEGPLTLSIKNIKTTIKKFFNLCDIVPMLINTIDWYAEYHLRGRSLELLSKVKSGSQTFSEASYDFACEYAECLIGLLDRIRDKNITLPKDSYLKEQFELNTKIILTNRINASQYIDGMLEAIIDFRTRYPSLKSYQNESNLSTYPLYEKIS